jgi:hypothetical protein
MKRKLYSAGSTMLEKIEHRETFFKEVPAKEDVTITTMVRIYSLLLRFVHFLHCLHLKEWTITRAEYIAMVVALALLLGPTI